MAIADVQTWLGGVRNYAVGIALLEQHGKPGAALLSLLQRGENGYSRERLAEALQKLADAATAAQQSVRVAPRIHQAMQAQAVVAAMSPELDDWPMSRYPVELQELKREAITWLREQDSLHGELRRIPTKDQRYTTALRIKELDDLIHAAFSRLDTFRKTGTDIGLIEEAAKTRVDLVQERNNLRSYISRIQKGTRQGTPEHLSNLKSRLALIQTELDVGNAR